MAHNATKHGFFSAVAVIQDRDGGESQEEFDELFAKLCEDLQPVGYTEELLVDRIAVNLWRKRRLLRYENGLISDRFSHRRDMIATGPVRERLFDRRNLLPLSPERRLELDERTDHLCMAVEDAARMLRYEAMIERQLNRDFTMLRELQLRRKSRTPVNGATPLGPELTKSLGQVHGKTNGRSNLNNLVSLPSQASEIRQTDTTTCADEEATAPHAQGPGTHASHLQKVDGAAPMTEEPMEPQAQEPGSDAADVRHVDRAAPPPEELNVSQAQRRSDEEKQNYKTKPKSPLFRDSQAGDLSKEEIPARAVAIID